MKKIMLVFLFLLFLFSNSVECKTIYVDKSVPYDKELQEQLMVIKPMFEEADATHDMELTYQALEKGYNLKKTGNAENIKKYNDLFSALIIEVSMLRYNLTADKKYLDRAYKWSKIAVKDRTNQIFSIRYDVILASEHLDLKEMTRAYDCYRAVDFEGAKDFEQDFKQIYKNTLEYKNMRSAEAKEKWKEGMRKTLMVLGEGAKNYGAALERQEYYDAIRSNNTKSTSCNVYGNQINCWSY